MIEPLNFEGLLKQAIGLDIATIGSSAIDYAIHTRQQACELKDPNAYWQLLRTSHVELQALIDVIVVPETWFFRDRDAFVALCNFAQEQWYTENRSKDSRRLLSLPCSSGEEPYSLAMALLDAGLPPSQFHVDAVDVSKQLLSLAHRAIYGKNSFRGSNLEFREQHFERTGQTYVLHDNVRKQVEFHHGNLFAADSILETQSYDVIFCRNLLIYFDRTTQDLAIQIIKRLLSPNGLLFVGPSETGLLRNQDFTSIKVPLSFAFRKTPCAPNNSEAATNCQQQRRAARKPSVLVTGTKGPSNRSTKLAAKQSKATKTDAGEQSITHARHLADTGKLKEAEDCCKAHLRKHGASAPVFQLLGVILEAAGDLAKADEFYRKALYLDQDHCDTLAHLACLLEKQGDTLRARVLRNRISRLEQKLAK